MSVNRTCFAHQAVNQKNRRFGSVNALTHLDMPIKRMMQTGTIESLNVSPKGTFEGLLLKTSKGRVQVNFASELSGYFVGVAKSGAEIKLPVEPWEAREGGVHDVFRLNEDFAVRIQEKDRSSKSERQFAGKIVRLNYALHGEVNGGLLDSGEFLHLKPHGAAQVKLKRGMLVSGEGKRKPATGQTIVIEAEQVNGIRLEKH